jgi:hypothetical protein
MTDDADSPGGTRAHSVSTAVRDQQRGQIDGRFIIGAVVVVLIAGTLSTVAADIQSTLAAAPVFSGFTAGMIAILLVLAIVLQLLGLE